MRIHIAIEPPEEHHGTVAYEQDWNAGLGRKRKNGGKNVQPPHSSSLHELLAELSGGGVGQGAEGLFI